MKPKPIVVRPKYIPEILNAGKPIIKPKRPTIIGDNIKDNEKGTPN